MIEETNICCPHILQWSVTFGKNNKWPLMSSNYSLALGFFHMHKIFRYGDKLFVAVFPFCTFCHRSKESLLAPFFFPLSLKPSIIQNRFSVKPVINNPTILSFWLSVICGWRFYFLITSAFLFQMGSKGIFFFLFEATLLLKDHF